MLSLYFFADGHIFAISLACSTCEKERQSCVKGIATDLLRTWATRLQSDNGGEFKRQVKDYCKSRKIKMINSHTYNPKAKGKVKRSHRSLRQKIYYDLIQQKQNRRQLS